MDHINRIEIMRVQVEDLRKQQAANKAVDSALAALYKRMYDTELHYLSRTEMHSDDKWYVEKYKLYMNLVWLLAEVGGSGGDVAGGVATRPTQAALNVFEDRLKEMDRRARRLHEADAGSGGLQQGERGEGTGNFGQGAGQVKRSSGFRVPGSVFWVPGSTFRFTENLNLGTRNLEPGTRNPEPRSIS